MPLKRGDLALLKWAIDEAAGWEGLYTGDGDMAERYARRIQRCREALFRVRELSKTEQETQK